MSAFFVILAFCSIINKSDCSITKVYDTFDSAEACLKQASVLGEDTKTQLTVIENSGIKMEKPYLTKVVCMNEEQLNTTIAKFLEWQLKVKEYELLHPQEPEEKQPEIEP